MPRPAIPDYDCDRGVMGAFPLRVASEPDLPGPDGKRKAQVTTAAHRPDAVAPQW